MIGCDYNFEGSTYKEFKAYRKKFGICACKKCYEDVVNPRYVYCWNSRKLEDMLLTEILKVVDNVELAKRIKETAEKIIAEDNQNKLYYKMWICIWTHKHDICMACGKKW
jgi:hypothetical protein